MQHWSLVGVRRRTGPHRALESTGHAGWHSTALTGFAGVVAQPAGRGASVDARPAQRVVAAHAQVDAALAARTAEVNAAPRAIQARPPRLRRLCDSLLLGSELREESSLRDVAQLRCAADGDESRPVGHAATAHGKPGNVQVACCDTFRRVLSSKRVEERSWIEGQEQELTLMVGASSRLAYLKVRTMLGWSRARPNVASSSSFADMFSAGVFLCSITCRVRALTSQIQEW